MPRRVNSKWLTKRETSFYTIDFSGLGTDRQGLLAEMNTAEAVIGKQAENSLLVAVDAHQTEMMDELAGWFTAYATRPHSPVRKMAILGISPFKRAWYRWTGRVVWPKTARYFDDYEAAKDWLIGEGGW
jgi:hypothetical protein